jgi:hypothetical protein
MGRHLDLFLYYYSVVNRVDPQLVARLNARNTILELALEPKTTMADLANGIYDTDLQAWAQILVNDPAPVWLRFASEMNGNWDVWDAGTDPVNNSPQQFIAAWQHFHHIVALAFQAAGQDRSRVKWVFTPAASPANTIASFYPGAAEVDILAMDGYNQPGNGWRDFSTIFADGYNALAALNPTLPLMLAEFASDRAENFGSGYSRSTWITQTSQELASQFSRIVAFTWFDQGTPSQPANGHSYALATDDGSYQSFDDAFGTNCCTQDAQCNGGQLGTGQVCSDSGKCIIGCHSNSDCPSGQSCDMSLPHWICD